MKKLLILSLVSLLCLPLLSPIHALTGETELYLFDGKKGKGSYNLREGEEGLFLEAKVIDKMTFQQEEQITLYDIELTCSDNIINSMKLEIGNQTYFGQKTKSNNTLFSVNSDFILNEAGEEGLLLKFYGTPENIQDTSLTFCDITTFNLKIKNFERSILGDRNQIVQSMFPINLFKQRPGGDPATLSISHKFNYPYYINAEHKGPVPLLFNFQTNNHSKVKLGKVHFSCSGEMNVNGYPKIIIGENQYQMNIERVFISEKFDSGMDHIVQTFSYDFNDLELKGDFTTYDFLDHNLVKVVADISNYYENEDIFCGFDKVNYNSLYTTNGTSEGESVRVVPSPSSIFSKISDISNQDINYEKYSYLINLGIINGYPDRTFRKNTLVNRAELAAMVRGAFVDDEMIFPSLKTSNCFEDLQSLSWYEEDVCLINHYGWVSGDNNANISYRPSDNISKIEALKIVMHATGRDKNLSSNNTNWYSKYVEKAENTGLIRFDYFNRDNPGELITRGELAVLIYDAIHR